jgi:hypothetical protein
MPSGTFVLHGPAIVSAFNKEFDFNDGNTKIAFATSSYTPDKDLHDYFNDVTNGVSGTNLTTAGVALANCAVSVISASDVVRFIADDVSVASVTATGIRVAVIYNDTAGASSTDPILGSITFDADMSPAAGTLAVDFQGTGNSFLSISY